MSFLFPVSSFEMGRVLAEWPTFSFAPALPVILLVPGMMAALVLCGLLYRA